MRRIVDFDQHDFPLVVAHRGASSTHPENTLEAFDAALEAGAHAVELDVRVCADGVAVVMHDPNVSRATDGQGLVGQMSLREIKRLDAGGGGRSRVEVPTVAEVLELVSGRGGVNLEIKNIPGQPDYDASREGALTAAVHDLDATSFSGPVLVSSFNPSTIARCRELAPDIPTGFLTIAAVDPDSALAHAVSGGHAFLLPQVEAVVGAGRDLIERAHDARIRVASWTVDDEARIRLLFEWGIDALASNEPALALAVRAAGSLGSG
jgi:glycerophosphoryl diester phosphodiesterase